MDSVIVIEMYCREEVIGVTLYGLLVNYIYFL